MITEIEIEGFKSFGSPAEKIRLGPLNFLVGANASGKSNLLSALEFIKNAVERDVEYAVNELGGASEIRNKVLNCKFICFRIKTNNETKVNVKVKETAKEFLIKSIHYDLKLSFDDKFEIVKIESEKLHSEIEYENEIKNFKLERNVKQVLIDDPINKEIKGQEENEYDIPEQEHKRLALATGFMAFPCAILREFILKWNFYNIDPSSARKANKYSSSIELKKSGENLAFLLHEIDKYNKEKGLENIIYGLKGVVPGFKDIKPSKSSIDGAWTFQVMEEKIMELINPCSVSDGTIRLLAMHAITSWTMRKSSFVAIEEPENGIHPHLMEYLVDLFREACEETNSQLLVTTHCADFLDYLEPEEVLLCDKIDGLTKIKRASNVENIEIFRKHFSLGELWEQGALGGTP